MDKDNLILARIISGYLIFKYKGETLYLIYPSLSLKYEAELFYDEMYDNYKFSDWITEDDILSVLKENKLWTDMNEKQFALLEKQIEQTKIELFKSFYITQKQKAIRAKLNNLKETYQKHFSIRHSLDHLTIKGFCEKYKNEFLVTNSIYKKENEFIKFFDIKYPDAKILDDINYEINQHQIDIPTFRRIARSPEWRSYWSSNKSFVFEKASAEWTDEQRTLVVFTKMYESAYDSTEPPPDPVFDDDDMFDGWMLLQNETAKKERNKKTEDKALGSKMSKAQEMFIMANSPDDVSDIYSMNNSATKAIIAERNSVIMKQKDVDASKLPDTQRDIAIMNQENFKAKLRK